MLQSNIAENILAKPPLPHPLNRSLTNRASIRFAHAAMHMINFNLQLMVYLIKFTLLF